jgi:hypothetical protein
MKLSTIQKRENLNTVHAEDEIGPGGAHQSYMICVPLSETESDYVGIKFQKGPRKEATSQHGVLDTDLLEIVRHRSSASRLGSLLQEKMQLHLRISRKPCCG